MSALPGPVVTGEAVPLDLRPATFLTRGIAAALDVALQVALLLGLVTLVALVGDVVDDAVLAGLVVLAVVAVFVGEPVLLETVTGGRSLGKLALGLRVVGDDGSPVRPRQSIVRALVGFGELWLTSGVVALVASAASARGKRVGDHLAGTVVLRERVPRARAAVDAHPGVPPAWSAALDLSGLPDALAQEARTFLGRTADLLPDRRAALGARYATAVAERVTPAPLPGMPPEAYLAAVLAERRRRELARLAGSTAVPASPVLPPLPAPAPPAPSPPGAGGFAPPV
ncbi:putative RDD family membrane protein YckC [Motilibacter rhizosphaerae]|uniref:Putative RDD family membrane protein YckC n=1 Tax=Motilibacter rhizosphaerae TaxID=598652 RepID=A0A4Q7NSR6_9ACTN|nr:RDD family protein [Motilibacter rhizosphaerae]RZS90147.1 putative RDD family membrane protein YckC [Motilibacter rhizosphaerae]